MFNRPRLGIHVNQKHSSDQKALPITYHTYLPPGLFLLALAPAFHGVAHDHSPPHGSTLCVLERHRAARRLGRDVHVL